MINKNIDKYLKQNPDYKYLCPWCRNKEKLIKEMVYKSKCDLFVKEPVRETQLDKALNRALEQQGQVHDTDIEKNGRTYVGPHKHIIGIIGSDDYSVH